MAYETVQFKGMEDTLAAFDARSVEVWGVWQGKRLITKGEGQDELQTFLKMLCKTGGVYTLKVFEDIDDLKKMKENTPADGSFNFRLFPEEGDESENQLTQWSASNNKNKLFQRLDAIEQKLTGIGAVPEEPKSLEETITDIITDPEKLQLYANILGSVFNKTPAAAPAQLYSGMAAVGNTTPMAQVTKEQQYQRISAALDILEQHDPKLMEHLEKLAMMAQDNPGMLKTILATLDSMK